MTTGANAGDSTASPNVALVETSDLLPGLLPFQAWDVLGTAEVILVRDAATHPFAAHLHLAGLDLHTLEPATLERGDLDLTRPGAPGDRRLAKALIQQARDTGQAVYLLGPDDERLALALAGMSAEHDVEIELVFLAQQPPGTELLRLVEVLRRLRDPDGGCPWDLEQDHTSLLRYLVEETYELVAAIEEGEDADLMEELGDVLLQVVFHAQVAADRRAFGIDDVARGIAQKLVSRHPHVFADGDASTAEEVQVRWDELKAEEKARSGPFDGVPEAGPGLDLLHTLHRKASRRGLLPPDLPPAVDGVRRALEQLEELARPPGAAAGAEPDHELLVGHLVEAAVTAAADLGIDPEAAARRVARERRRRTEAALARLAAEGGGEVEVATTGDVDVATTGDAEVATTGGATVDAEGWARHWRDSAG